MSLIRRRGVDGCCQVAVDLRRSIVNRAATGEGGRTFEIQSRLYSKNIFNTRARCRRRRSSLSIPIHRRGQWRPSEPGEQVFARVAAPARRGAILRGAAR